MIAALLSLQRSFGIVPANRGIREGGLYRIVRHPLYAAELLVFLGVVLVTPTPWNILIWTIECGVQHHLDIVGDERTTNRDGKGRPALFKFPVIHPG